MKQFTEQELRELLAKAFDAGEQHESRRDDDAAKHIDRVQLRRNILNKLINDL